MMLPLVADMLTLVAVYQVTGGPEWYNNDGWLVDGVPPCQWHGVTCNAEMRISSIDLSQNNLQGSLPLQFWQIPSLESISLAENPQLEVQFDRVDMSNLNQPTSPLRHINISHTATVSLNGLEIVTGSLESLDISASNVTQQEDLEHVLALHNLTHLYMNHIPISDGFFADQLVSARNLPWLQTLSLSNASISGTLPALLGAYTDLQVLDLSYNALSGSLPAELLYLTKLRKLHLQSQNSQQQQQMLELHIFTDDTNVNVDTTNATDIIEGTVTSRNTDHGTKKSLGGPLLDFRHCSFLYMLDLSTNQFEGEIPRTFLAGLPVYSTEPLVVNLRRNRLVGQLPPELARFSFLNIDVTDNQISEIPSVLCDQMTWMEGLVEKVGCDAILCPPGTYNEHGRQTTVQDQCNACSGIRGDTWLSTSDYYGSIDCTTFLAFAQGNTMEAAVTPPDEIQQQDEGIQAGATAPPQNVETGQQDQKNDEQEAGNMFPQGIENTEHEQVDNLPVTIEDQGQQDDFFYSAGILEAREKNDKYEDTNNTAADGEEEAREKYPKDEEGAGNENVESMLEGSEAPPTDEQGQLGNETAQENAPVEQGSEEVQAPSNGGQNLDPWISLYQETGGENWWKSDGWLNESVPLCEWHGIGCSEDDRVIEIFLGHNGLVGTIPPEFFGMLPDLEWIDFHSNPRLSIDFSAVGPVNNTSIETFLLAETATTSIEGIASLAPSLLRLDLNSTLVSAETVKDIFGLSSIEILHMGDTSLESIPEAAADAWTNLKVLTAPRSGLSGTLPARMGELTNLQYIDLSDNQFVGSIPASFDNMESLAHLNLQSQLELTGTLISFEKVPLRYLDLSENQLTSTIPSNFLAGGNHSDVIHIDLRGNSLTGALPGDLAKYSSMHLDLTANNIDSLPPQLCDAIGWMGGFVAAFGCDAIMCPPGTFSRYGRMISNSVPCQSCNSASDHHIFYGSTACTFASDGAIEGSQLSPNWNIFDREILELLFETTGGATSWVNTDNWSQESSDVCDWYGIECNNSTGLIGAIVLNDNNLTGTTPLELFQVNGLERLYLNGNEDLVVDMSGIGLRGEPSIRAIVAPNTATYSTQGLSQASSTLQVLDLSSTKITGEAITDIYTLSSLQRLNIGNNFIRGPIHASVGQLLELTEFRAPNCFMSGTLPAAMGELTKLSVLDFSSNNLIGLLPRELENLVGLKVLDLKNQHLRGRLIAFESLPSLTQVDLSRNFFIGSIPTDLLSGLKDKFTPIDLDISRNSLTGTLPKSLRAFENLSIDATGNLITSLPNRLCSESSWMLGDVGAYGCDAILCPPLTYNSYGRQVSDSDPCEPCLVNNPQPFFGARGCLEATEEHVHSSSNACPEIDGIPYAGTSCQYVATSICSLEGPYVSFCTNGGGCVELVDSGATHVGCICPEAFSGSYCEVGIGDPTSITTDDDTETKEGRETWHWAIWIAIPAAVICIIMAIMAVAHNRRRKHTTKKFHGSRYIATDDIKGEESKDVERGLASDNGAPSAIAVDTSRLPDLSSTHKDDEEDDDQPIRAMKTKSGASEPVVNAPQSALKTTEIADGEDSSKKSKKLRFSDDLNGNGDAPPGDNMPGAGGGNGGAEGVKDLELKNTGAGDENETAEETTPESNGVLLGHGLDGFIGDINETTPPESPDRESLPSSNRPIGRSLLKGGVQEDDSVSVSESVSLIDSDSERSVEGRTRAYISMPPSLAATMFAVQEASETSSGDVSLNF